MLDLKLFLVLGYGNFYITSKFFDVCVLSVYNVTMKAVIGGKIYSLENKIVNLFGKKCPNCFPVVVGKCVTVSIAYMIPEKDKFLKSIDNWAEY